MSRHHVVVADITDEVEVHIRFVRIGEQEVLSVVSSIVSASLTRRGSRALCLRRYLEERQHRLYRPLLRYHRSRRRHCLCRGHQWCRLIGVSGSRVRPTSIPSRMASPSESSWLVPIASSMSSVRPSHQGHHHAVADAIIVEINLSALLSSGQLSTSLLMPSPSRSLSQTSPMLLSWSSWSAFVTKSQLSSGSIDIVAV